MNNPRVTKVMLHPLSGTIEYELSHDQGSTRAFALLPFGLEPVPHAPDSYEMSIVLAHVLHLHQQINGLQHQVSDLQKVIATLSERLDAKADKQPSA